MKANLSRREFGPALLTAAGGAGTAVTVCGDEPPPPQDPAISGVPESAAPVDLLLAALLALHPSSRLTPDRQAGIRAGLQRNLELGRILRRVPLENGDGPATVFRAAVTPLRPAGN